MPIPRQPYLSLSILSRQSMMMMSIAELRSILAYTSRVVCETIFNHHHHRLTAVISKMLRIFYTHKPVTVDARNCGNSRRETSSI